MENSKKIISIALAGTIIFSGIGIGITAKLKKNSQYDGHTMTSSSSSYTEIPTTTDKNVENTILESITTTTEIPSTQVLNKIETTQSTVQTSPSKVETIDLYSKLKGNLISVLNKKNWSVEVKECILVAFDYIYINYDQHEEVFKINNISSKEEFIMNAIINNLDKNVLSFKMIDLNKSEYGISGGTYDPSEKSIEIGYYGSYEDDWNIIQTIIHEIIHANQTGLFKNENLSSELFSIFSEGNALFYDNLIDDYITSMSIKTNVNANNERYALKGNMHFSENYIIYSKCYGSIACLVDNQILNEFIEKGNINIISDYLNSEYNIDGNLFLKEMGLLVRNFNNGNEAAFVNNLINVEQTINKCFYSKLNSLNSKEEIIQFMNLKRYYDMQYSCKKLKDCSDYYFTIENKSELDLYNVNDCLYNKCLEYGIISTFSQDDLKNREVFGSIMGENTLSSYGEKKSVLSEKYSLSEDENVLTIYDNDGNPIIQHNYLTNETIREKNKIKKEYVVSEPTPILNSSFFKTM